MLRKCTSCKIEKELEYFNKDASRYLGHSYQCKECKKYYQQNSNRNKEYRKEYSKKYYQQNYKARRDYDKKYKDRNKEYHLNYAKEYRIKNIEIIKEKEKIYNNLNKDKINKKSRDKYLKDLNFKLVKILRARINYSVNKIYKNNSSLKYLGCSLEEYKQHLEKQFDENMTWENYGIYWEVDHIYPISKFDLTIEDNIFKAFHFSNTQPLTISENRSKKDKII